MEQQHFRALFYNVFFFYRLPPCSLLACEYISRPGIASDTDILAVGINAALREVFMEPLCGKRNTDGLLELAACLEKS